MKNTLKERLEEYIRHKNLSNKAFEEKANLSNGFVSKVGKNIRDASLDKILEAFPDFPKKRILFGIEDSDAKVVGDNNFSNNGYIAGNINHQGRCCESLEKELREQIALKNREIEHLREIIANKEEIISLLKQQLNNSNK